MFYTLLDNQLIAGPMVQFPDGTLLHTEFLDTYEFPVNGYYYFETEQEAKNFFGITE